MSSENKVVCCECDKEVDSVEFLFRHLRTHSISSKDYILKWKYGGKIPLCVCGCNGKNNWNVALRDFTRFIQGHHATGRIKSDEEKAKIGSKNAENMKRWMAKHPEVAKRKIKELQKGRTPEVYKRISESVHRFWATSPFAATLRKEASDRAVRLIAENKIGPQAPYKREYKFNPFTNQEEYMHSSWETAFMDTCIARGYPVTKDHGITIPYTHPDGSQRTYVPDFYAFDDRVLYEVKGRHDDVDEAKWEAADVWCKSRGMSFQCLFSQVLDT